MNRTIIIVTGALLAVAGAVFAYSSGRDAQGPVAQAGGAGKLSGAPTDFSREGIVLFERVGGVASSPFFSYVEKGEAAGTSTELVFDAMSYCGGSSGSVPCMAMSATLDVPFGGKQAIVEGVAQTGPQGQSQVLVRKLYRLEEGEPVLVPDPGSVFISWPQARAFIESCAPAMVTQTHSLDVYLTMPDGTKLRAVEPVIDEVFGVVEGARGSCGQMPVATE